MLLYHNFFIFASCYVVRFQPTNSSSMVKRLELAEEASWLLLDKGYDHRLMRGVTSGGAILLPSAAGGEENAGRPADSRPPGVPPG